MFGSVCELFGETIRNIFGCSFYFAIECYGGLECGWRCSIGYTVYELQKSMYVGCACDTSVHLDVPSIGVVYVRVCRKKSPHFGV